MSVLHHGEKEHAHSSKRHHHHRRRHAENESSNGVEGGGGGRFSPPFSVEEERKSMDVLRGLCSEAANKLCADCKETGTQWTSVNLGIFLCIRCAGVHRSLGTHITKVKSTSMDSWTPTEVLLLQAIGNERAEGFYESRMPSSIRLKPVTNESERRIRIEKKYVTGEYAMEDVKKRLKSIYKSVGYGAYASPTRNTMADMSKSSAKTSHRVKEDGVSTNDTRKKKKREEAMQALYGDTAKPFSVKDLASRGSKAMQDTEKEILTGQNILSSTTKNKKTSREEKKSKTIRGPFGIVNVNSGEEMEEKLANLLRCFGIRQVSPGTSGLEVPSSTKNGKEHDEEKPSLDSEIPSVAVECEVPQTNVIDIDFNSRTGDSIAAD